MAGLQEAFDLVPRVAVGRRGYTPYTVTCVIGLSTALVGSVAVGAIVGLSGLTVLAMWGAAVIGLVSSSGLRWLLTRRHTQVALEQIWGVLGTVGLAMWLLDAPVLRCLDVAGIGCALMLGIGRIGCAMTGCCYGRPSRVGLLYGDDHGRLGLPAVVVGVATFPVAMVETVGSVLVAGFTSTATILGTPGAGLVTYLLLAGGLRYLLEGVRGDPRPEFGGVSAPRWMAGAQMIAGVALAIALPRAWPQAAVAAAALAIFGTALAIAVLAYLYRGGVDPLARSVVRAATKAIRTACATPGAPAQASRLTDAVTMVVTVDATATHVSLSGAGVATLAELAAQALDGYAVSAAYVSTAGVLHIAAVPTDRTRWRAVPWRRTEIAFGRAHAGRVHEADYFAAT